MKCKEADLVMEPQDPGCNGGEVCKKHQLSRCCWENRFILLSHTSLLDWGKLEWLKEGGSHVLGLISTGGWMAGAARPPSFHFSSARAELLGTACAQ